MDHSDSESHQESVALNMLVYKESCLGLLACLFCVGFLFLVLFLWWCVLFFFPPALFFIFFWSSSTVWFSQECRIRDFSFNLYRLQALPGKQAGS